MKYFVVVLSLLLILLFVFMPKHKMASIYDALIRNQINDYMKIALNKDSCDIPTIKSCSENIPKISYVMGGDQKSLENRMGLAAKLYHEGIVKKIVTFKNAGITEYSPELKRNLTNDEWVLRLLKKNGVDENQVELVDFKTGFFGTLTEISELEELCISRKWHHIIIVSSDYHTARIQAVTQGFKLSNVVFYKICGSPDKVSVFDLCREYFKLFCYRSIIVPIYQ